MLETFDIFETCLVRQVAEPAQVFDHVADRLGLGEGFGFLRREAEVEARQRSGGEVDLGMIYEVVAEWTGLDRERVAKVRNAELDEERRQLVAVTEMKERVGEARRAGKRIGFLSDMYLPADFLERTLRATGFFEDGDRLWVSAESGDSKASGALYERVRRETGETRWRHWGNHAGADVRQAVRHGVEGRHFEAGNLARYERLMADFGARGLPGAREWAGLSRLARLTGEEIRDEGHEVVSRVSAGVAGPVVLGFASWVVDRAVAHGVDKVFFLARDGQGLMAPFRTVAEHRGLELEAKYLYASRIALRFPREFPMSEQAAAGVFQQCQGKIPLAGVAARLGVGAAEVGEWMGGAPGDGMLEKGQVGELRRAVGSERAVSRLREVAAEREHRLGEYLRQEGLADGGKALVVDLGWAGSLQAGLAETMSAMGAETELIGLYFGLTRPVARPGLKMEAYLFDSRRGDRVPNGSWLTTFAEMMCQADHGSTLGFERREGRIAPVFDGPDGENPRVPGWLQTHRATIDRFVEGACRAEALPPHPKALKPMLLALILRFWGDPDPEEARVWGEVRFASAGVAGAREALAPRPLGPRDWCWVMGSGALGYGRSLWREGSSERLPRMLARLARLIRKVKRTDHRRFRRVQSAGEV